MNANVGRVIGTCGLGVIHGFEHNFGYGQTLSVERIRQGGGIGYTVVGFVNQPRCKKMYEWIKERYDIVFQSPVKKNRNSRRKFFFIVFKEKSK
jgi:hypothetical protein